MVTKPCITLFYATVFLQFDHVCFCYVGFSFFTVACWVISWKKCGWSLNWPFLCWMEHETDRSVTKSGKSSRRQWKIKRWHCKVYFVMVISDTPIRLTAAATTPTAQLDRHCISHVYRSRHKYSLVLMFLWYGHSFNPFLSRLSDRPL